MPQLESNNSSAFSFLYGSTVTSIHDNWKNHSFDYMHLGVKVMSLLFNTLSRFVIAFLPGASIFQFHGCSHHLECIFFLFSHFKIIIGLQGVAEIVERGPQCPSTSFPSGNILHKDITGTKLGNWQCHNCAFLSCNWLCLFSNELWTSSNGYISAAVDFDGYIILCCVNCCNAQDSPCSWILVYFQHFCCHQRH